MTVLRTYSKRIEEKESQRWIDMLWRARDTARQAPGTRIICVADSEADIYELLTSLAKSATPMTSRSSDIG